MKTWWRANKQIADQPNSNSTTTFYPKKPPNVLAVAQFEAARLANLSMVIHS
jgi:hypothetical protein